jgi:sterol desaturase/sphingolipid hydroxylase (fatty acid hydroxylase superfamily)
MPNLLYYAIPVFIFLLLAEVLYSTRMVQKKIDWKDFGVSLSMGAGNLLTGLVTKSWIFIAYSAAYQFRLFDFKPGIWSWLILFVAEDLTYYWFHRSSHQIRYFWASHVVHHSSTSYNLSTALRQTWTGNASGAFVFWLWLPLLGFHPLMILTMQALSLIYQFWIHTESIKKLPRWFEFLFNTPSHHRVHHGSEDRYLDKNHGGVLIIWDRLFGTFIEEDGKSFPVYGLTTNIHTHHPVKVAFHEWQEMLRDVWNSNSFKEGINYIVRSPGWLSKKNRDSEPAFPTSADQDK